MKPEWIQSQVNLKSYNTWKTGGVAEFFALPDSLDQYKEAISWAVSNQHQITFLGQGSNSLISDQELKGLVLCSKKFEHVDVQIETKSPSIKLDKDLSSAPKSSSSQNTTTDSKEVLVLKCQAGALKYKVMRLFLKHNLSPSLFLSGIPGDVGGGVVMNAGVSENITPKEFSEVVKSFKVLKWKLGSNFQFEIKEYQNSDIDWSYRSSKNWQPGFIYEVTLEAPLNPVEDMAEKVKAAIQNRKLKQPWDKPSCGSVFVNPPGHRSGQLIEATGLKGFQIGGAQVSYKHANFIVNTGNATSKDIHQVIEHVKLKVFEKFQIQLHTEVVYLGEW
jgi:UDP-N-acetylmuramate dehydrogenase